MGRRTRELMLAAAVCGTLGWALYVPVRRAYLLDPAMRRAVEQGNAKAVRRLAQQGANVNLDLGAGIRWPSSLFETGTPLCVAIGENDRETLRLLIRRGADMETLNSAGDTPLIYAIKTGKVEMAGELLRTGAGANTKDHRGHTPLMRVVWRYVPEDRDDAVTPVRLLLRHGADPAIAANDFTALAWAEEFKAKPLVNLLRRPGCEDRNQCLDRIAAKGPLYAVRSGHLDAVKRLVRQKVSFRVRDAASTTLTAAASEANEKLLPYLLQHARGIDRAFINERADGETALIVAAYSGCWNSVKAVLNAGADPNLLDVSGRSALHYAAVTGASEILPYLLAAGADLDLKDREGRTALDEAKDHRKIAMIRSLREAGANEQATDMRSRRAHEAMQRR